VIGHPGGLHQRGRRRGREVGRPDDGHPVQQHDLGAQIVEVVQAGSAVERPDQYFGIGLATGDGGVAV
jgi:hypothetical protein